MPRRAEVEGRLLDLVGELVAINSVNPDLAPGGPGEGEIAEFVAQWATEHGLDVRVEEASPRRPNVIAAAKGSGGGASVMLNAHLDTVGVSGAVAPFAPRIDGGRLYGRGALDTKAGLAAALLVGAWAVRANLAGDVVIAAVIDEEYASVGTEELLGSVTVDAAVVLEPTDLVIAIAHRGFNWARITVAGRAAHGSRYDDGVDAISHAGALLDGLLDLQRSLLDEEPHPLLGTGSAHGSVIGGGVEFSTYPAACVIDIERRTLPGDDSRFAIELERLCSLVRAPATASAETILRNPPLATDPKSRIVRSLQSAREAVGDHPTDLGGATFRTDAALLSAAGIPSVVFGPGGGGIHEPVEWVDMASLVTCYETLRVAVADFCA